MTHSVYIPVLILSLACLWVIFDAGYRSSRVGVLRSRLFELRSELFEYARSGALGAAGFSDPAYRQARRMLNSYIRFAHQLTLFRMFVLLWSSRWWLDHARLQAEMQEFAFALTQLKPIARGRLLHVLKEAELAIVTHMLVINVLGFAILKPLLMIARLVRRQRTLRASCAREIQRHRNLLIPLEQEAVQRLDRLESFKAA